MNNGRIKYGKRPIMQPMMPPLSMPTWLTKRGIVIYIIALMIISIMYQSYSLPWYYMLSGVVSVVVFFGFGGTFTTSKPYVFGKEVDFAKRIFLIAFGIRLVWTLLIYTVFMQSYGDPYGFESLDATYYDELGLFVSGLIGKGNFNFYEEIAAFSGLDDISDMGFGIYVGFIYWLTGSSDVSAIRTIGESGIITNPASILTVRFLKCLWSALTVVLMYRLAKRNFGEQIGRLTAVFVALWPNFWYYCGTHLKETEMVFLAVLFVEQADQMLRSRQFTAWKVIPVLVIATAILTFRAPLALVAVLALIFSVVMSSTRVVSWGKRIVVGGLAVVLIAVTMGNRLEERAQDLMEQASVEQQQRTNEWRGERKDGNSFAKYAGATVFAPMIFTLPFPSMVRPFEGQDVQQLLNGGNYIKNIISCFTIFAMVMLLMSGEWRKHLLPLSFMLGYLVVLVMSTFAHSERFHQPIMPFEMMFAAYGLGMALTKKKYKRWFDYWGAIMFVACIVWNWFKIKGRGL